MTSEFSRAAHAARSGKAALLARFGLASAFLFSGVTKAADFAGTIGEVRALTGLEPAGVIAMTVILVQLAGAALLIWGGRAVRFGAVLLGGFTLAATFVAHDFWNAEDGLWVRQATTFLEHMGLVAGFFLAVVLSESD